MINVNSSNQKIKLTVSSGANKGSVNVSPDMSRYYTEKSKENADKAKEWAISDKIVDNEDYSSKYYAQKSKEQAQVSTEKTIEVVNSGNEALSNIGVAKTNAISDILENKDNAITDIINSSELAREWAVSPTIVDNDDYSAKYYAEKAKDNSGIYYDELTEEVIDIEILQEEYATKDLLQQELGTKQDIILDLDTIRSGAAKGSTALQSVPDEYVTETELNAKGYLTSYTETDPIYTADKPKLALKSEIPIVPTKVSSFTNDVGYQTATDVAGMIASIPQFEIKIVNELPATGQKMVLYLLPKTSASGDDIYDEYIWIERTSSFELVGSTTVDLSDYYKKTETDKKLETKQDVIPDLETIRSGASKGATALQSYTETDPLYTADKPKIALKSEIPTKISQLINDNDFTSQNYISSMGENLVVNGTGLLKNNFNFTQFTFDPTDGVESSGCFKYINSNRGAVFTTNYMPFDRSQSYTLSYYVKNSELTKTSDFLNFIDMDGYSISSNSVVFVENTLMELTQPLKKGDTVVYVNDASKIVTTLNRTYNKGFIFWNYKSSSGFDYGVETYSRWFYLNLYSYENVDTVNNTITLNSPWNGLNFEAGWKLSQSSSGVGTYSYGNLQYFPTPGVWEHKTFTFTKDKHFKGASYIKIGWLINYSDKENNEFKISTVMLSSKQNNLVGLQGYDATKTQTLKHVKGVLQWVSE